MEWTKNPTEKELTKLESDFKKIAKQLQGAVIRVALAQLASFALGDGGRVVFTVANAARAGRLNRTIARTLGSERPSLLQRLLDAMLAIFTKNTNYFKAQNLTITAEDAARKRILLLYGYNEDTGEVIPGSYLEQALNVAGLAGQVGRIIQASIINRDTLPQMQARIKQTVNGRGKLGMVESHLTRVTAEMVAEYDRAVKDNYREELGLTYFVYAGTAVEDTRPFCEARLNRVYTTEVFPEWNRRTWAGKKPTLPVEIAQGGYQCRHSYNYVSEAIAKRIAERRGIEVNTYDAGIDDRGYS